RLRHARRRHRYTVRGAPGTIRRHQIVPRARQQSLRWTRYGRVWRGRFRGTGDSPCRARREHPRGGGLAVTGRLQAASATPSQMAAQLARLRAAFPAFSFKICHGWHGLMFEAWRDPAAGGLYAMITSDADEMRRELETASEPRASGRSRRP